MAKGLRILGQVAGAVSLVTSVIPTLQPVAAIAGAVSAVATVGAQLTAPRPIARGTPARVTIDVEPPRPYLVGQVMTGGTMRHDVAYGATLKKVPNPYRWQVRVLSGGGGIQGIISEHFDFQPISSFYGAYIAFVQNLGETPQTTALVPPYGAAPGWDSTSKISGSAHVGLNFLFDRDGERFAAGLPIYTALCQGEKVYSVRNDSTYPGGSGPCRAGDESTYIYSANPADHLATYALGRFQNGKRVFGLGQAFETIDWPAIIDWANDCDSNSWTANGILTEGGEGAVLRQQRIRNMDDLCAAGGARWTDIGGVLTVDWHRPRVSIATLTDDDFVKEGGGTDAVPTVRDRINGIRPQYVDPDSNWQQITAEEIIGTTYRTEDGEPLTQDWALNAVTNAAQAGELAAYAMADSRELGPMDFQLKSKWRFYRPGDAITVNASLAAYSGQAVINERSLNPQTHAVGLSLKSETPGKHLFALGKVAVPPPTPVLAQTTEERDLLAAAAITPRATDIVFDDGQNAEDLQPGEAGASRNIGQGTYDNTSAYIKGDQVRFNGSSYRLIVDSSQGNPPPDDLRWDLFAEAGSGPAGDDGLPGITFVLTNENHSVATDADGNGGDYTGAGGSYTLRRGTTVLAPTFSIPARTPATSWITIDASGNFTVTDPGVDFATATIRAAWAGINYDRTYTLTKTLRGAEGPNLKLTASDQAFTFEDQLARPSSQTITLTAGLTNLTGTASFTTSPVVTLGGTGNSRTLSLANFGSNRQVTVEATLDGITDRQTIVRLDKDVVAPADSNRVPFSKMEAGRGWAILANPDNISTNEAYSDFDGFRFYRVDAITTAADQQISIGSASQEFFFRVTEGERLSVQAQIALSNTAAGSWFFDFEHLDENGALITRDVVASGTGVVGVGGGPEAGFVTVASGSRWGKLVLRGISNGAGVFRTLISEPMVSSARVGQTLHPPYVPGPNASDGAQVNPANLAELDPAQNTKLDGVENGATNTTNTNQLVDGAELGQTADYPRVTGTPNSLGEINPGEGTKLGGIETGAQVNPADLAALDPDARAELDAATGQTRQTVGFGQVITRSIPNNGTNECTAIVSRAPGPNGTIAAQIQYRLSGNVTWITLATGNAEAVAPSEPGVSAVSATFTNTTGSKQAFQFRMNEVRSPSNAGGNQIASQTYLEA